MPINVRTRLVLLAAVGLLTSACGAQPETPTIDCTAVTVPKYSELTILPLCTSCHASTVTGSARERAPTNVNLDSYAAAVAEASRSAADVNGGVMPPSNQPQPSEQQKTALYAWALCGTPN